MEEHQEMSVEKFEKFTWKIENFSSFKLDICSDPFVLGGYTWIIVLDLGLGNKGKDHLSIYLEPVQFETAINLTEGWSRYVKWKLFLFDQVDSSMTITKEFKEELNAKQKSWCFDSFISLADLHDPNKGFIVKDTCIVGAEIFVLKSTHENLFSSIVFGNPTGHIEVETITPDSTLVCTETTTKHTDAELFSPSIQELMDFSSVGQLEEACSDNASLIERPPKRSRKFNDLSFAALGRVLYFLKTRKLKDIDEQACKDLQVLWDELAKFKFDLTWLEPRVQSCLEMKSYVKKTKEVEKLKENVVAVELESKRLRGKLSAAEASLDIEKDLLKTKGLKERDLDSDLWDV